MSPRILKIIGHFLPSCIRFFFTLIGSGIWIIKRLLIIVFFFSLIFILTQIRIPLKIARVHINTLIDYWHVSEPENICLIFFVVF